MRTVLLQQTFTLDWIGPLLMCESEICRVPLGIAGIYLLHVFVPKLGGYPVYYVGQSQSLRQRLLKHLKAAKPSVAAARNLDPPYWSAAPVLAAALRSRVESGLIRLLRPICNLQVPRASP